jgi:hypothetical protein
MENSFERIAMERIQFFTGQRLFTSDLQILEENNLNMRWCHNISLHQPGIGIGFLVDSRLGDCDVSVHPGYAIDSNGREIVLTSKQRLSIPPVSNDGFGNPVNYDLVISYPEDRFLDEVSKAIKIKASKGALRLKDEPVFHWVELDRNLQPKDDKLKLDIKNGLKLILKRIGIKNCIITRIFTELKTRKAHPERSPHIFAGATNAQTTEWEFWTEKYYRPYNGGWVDYLVGLKLFVNTSYGKFNKPPRYTARVAGKRFFFRPDINPEYFLLEGFLNITKAEDVPMEKGFELRISMPYIKPNNYPLEINPRGFFKQYFPDYIEDLRHDLHWHIIWMGIEE